MTASLNGGLCLKSKSRLEKNRVFHGNGGLSSQNRNAARYLDPKYSRWMSADPAVSDYIPADAESAKKLPAGGVYNLANLNLYHYTYNNPIRYCDPTGEFGQEVKFFNKGLDALIGGDFVGALDNFAKSAGELEFDAALTGIAFTALGGGLSITPCMEAAPVAFSAAGVAFSTAEYAGIAKGLLQIAKFGISKDSGDLKQVATSVVGFLGGKIGSSILSNALGKMKLSKEGAEALANSLSTILTEALGDQIDQVGGDLTQILDQIRNAGTEE